MADRPRFVAHRHSVYAEHATGEDKIDRVIAGLIFTDEEDPAIEPIAEKKETLGCGLVKPTRMGAPGIEVFQDETSGAINIICASVDEKGCCRLMGNKPCGQLSFNGTTVGPVVMIADRTSYRRRVPKA